MALREFELFHGAILTKLVRSERPITLLMIETEPSKEWAVYLINNEVSLLLKHSKKPQALGRPPGGRRWTFVFSGDQLHRARGGEAWVALACGSERVNDAPMETCLLGPPQLADLLSDGGSNANSITVECEPGKSLRVRAPRSGVMKVVARNRLDKWLVPGR